MNKEQILKCFYEITSHVSRDNTARYMRNHSPEEYNELLRLTDFLCKFDSEDKNHKISIFERIYCIEHNLSDRPLCIHCHTNYVCSFDKVANQYRKWCSARCQASDDSCVKKSKITRKSRYGDENFANVEKSKQTRLQKYGKWHDSDFGDKVRVSKLNHYGQSNYVNVEKMKATKTRKYGTANYNNKNKNKITRKSNFYRILCNDEHVIPLFSLEEYIESDKNTPLRWKCKDCGNTFVQKFNYNFKRKIYKEYHVRCSTCFPHQKIVVSNRENEVAEFMRTIYPGKIERSVRDILYPQELDIVIRDRKLAVEFDGLYWHSTALKTKDYHVRKTERCESCGFKLIHIFEDEWNYKKNIVESMLRDELSIYSTTINSSECEIRDVSNDETRAFLSENCIRGTCSSSVNIGLYYNDRLVSMMTFGKPRFNKNYEWEMKRWCNLLNYNIIGAHNKMFQHFLASCNPCSVITYLDRRWYNTNPFEDIGFSISHKSRPDYYYVDRDFSKRYYRLNFTPKQMNEILDCYDASASEYQNMKLNNFERIYDCGCLVLTNTIY